MASVSRGGSSAGNGSGSGPLGQAGGEAILISDLLDFTRWHIDRYDRLRSSTSTRASVLLSANSVLITGTALLVNYHYQSTKNSKHVAPEIFFSIFAAASVVLVMYSLWNCISAIAALKTVRKLHPNEIPRRFLYNWGDTLKSVDGYSNFSSMVVAQTLEEILASATAELWTDILQHSQRHRHLRSAIISFRYCIISFFLLTGVAFGVTIFG